MKQNATDFKWVSQQLCELYDNVKNNKFSICLESGCSQDLTTGIISYLQSRLSFKIKGSNLAHSKIEIDFTYYDIYELLASIKHLSEGKIQNVEHNSYNKNKHRKLIINENQTGEYIVLIKDNQSSQQQLSVQITKRQLSAIKTLIFNAINNWISYSQNIQLLLSNQSIASKLDGIKSTPVTQSVNIPCLLDTPSDEEPEPEPDYTEEIPEETETTENTEIAEDPEETDDEPVSFDVEYKAPVVEVNDISSQLSSLLSDDTLSTIELDGKKSDYVPRVHQKVVNTTPRPFLNNFLNWNIDLLFDWVNGLILCDSNTKDSTLKPIEMFLLKSIGKEHADCILNSKYINQFEYEIISNIKEVAKQHISGETSTKSKSQAYRLDDVNIITREQNRPLWDFVVDSLALFFMFRYFTQKLDLFKKVHNKPQSDCSTDIRFACDFMYSYIVTLYNTLDKNDIDQFIKEDIANVLIVLMEHNTQDKLDNCFSEISMGGKIDINLSKINDFADKYINMMNTQIVYNDYSDKYDDKFNDFNNIRTALGLLINPIVKKDYKKELLIKYVESVDGQFDLTKFDAFQTFNDVDANVLQHDDIRLAYSILFSEPTIKTLKDLKIKVNQLNKEKEKVDEARNKVVQEHNDVKKEMWDIADSDEDLENIFS
jgi:hypothetical protein